MNIIDAAELHDLLKSSVLDLESIHKWILHPENSSAAQQARVYACLINVTEALRISNMLEALEGQANALLHQIDIGDFVDGHGHSAKMLKPVHDLMRLLAAGAAQPVIEKHVPLFAGLIAQHEGLAEELAETVSAAVPSRESILGAVARGWCHPSNSRKEMDSDLALAISDEIMSMLSAAPQPPAPSAAVPIETLHDRVRAINAAHGIRP